MTIHQNLRAARKMSGFTQEEVANRVGLTRQAISGYESGRTQPDLEMLIKLAEVYQTDLTGILYGQSPEQKRQRIFRLLLLVLSVSLLLLLLVRSCLIFLLNLYLSIPTEVGGTDALLPLIEARFSLLRLGELLGGLAQFVSLTGCLILAVWSIGLHHPPTPQRALLWAGCMVTGSLLFSLSFGLWDPLYRPIDYLLPLLGVLCPVLFFTLFSVILYVIRKRSKVM